MGPEKDENRAWLITRQHCEWEMAALDFLNLALSPVCAFKSVKKLGSVIIWICQYFAAACKIDYSVCEDRFTYWVSVVSEISKGEGCRFTLSPSQKKYAAVCALGLGEQPWEECTSVSSLPFPTQGAAVWSAWADSHWHDFNQRWPLLSTGNSRVGFYCLVGFFSQMVNI